MSPNAPPPSAEPVAVDENQIVAERRAKLAELARGRRRVPERLRAGRERPRTCTPRTTRADALELEADATTVSVAGRMMLKRVMGKASFATIKDGTGAIQLYVATDAVGADAYAAFKRFDLGDIVGGDRDAVQDAHRRAVGQGDVDPPADEVAASAARQVPRPRRPGDEVPAALRRPDRQRRRRAPRSSRAAATISAIRGFMTGHGFLEVETPMLHPIPGGAAAKPFVTHHNALDMPMFLRIAPELYLKRLVVGGFERVFEINRNFRNEGVEPAAQPRVHDARVLRGVHRLPLADGLHRVADPRCGRRARPARATLTYQGRELDLSKPFERLTIVDAIAEAFAALSRDGPRRRRRGCARELAGKGVAVGKPPFATAGVGALQLALFEETAESQLWQPTYIVDYPVEVSPLARESDTRPGVTERFELFITGREIANGFSELNDAEDQAARFQAQAAAKEAGDEEAMYYDADYIRALEYGMPPTGGCGIGIDRLVMLLTDAPNIRDVILFPHMRREE